MQFLQTKLKITFEEKKRLKSVLNETTEMNILIIAYPTKIILKYSRWRNKVDFIWWECNKMQLELIDFMKNAENYPKSVKAISKRLNAIEG